MDDLAACIDLCESNGFPGPAAALRALAGGRGQFYMVRALMPVEEAEYYGIEPGDLAPSHRKIFLDHAAAWRHSDALTARALRKIRASGYVRNPFGMPDQRFCREVGAILGTAYELPEREGDSIFPESATDEQLLRVAEFVGFELFHVAQFGGGPDVLPPADR